MNRTVLFVALAAVAAAVPADAQGRGQSQGRTQVENRAPIQDRAQSQSRGPVAARGPVAVPPGHWPSAGRCRVWIDGVAPGRQPRETDCLTARRTVPPNGRVLEGASRYPDDRYGRTDRYGRDDDDRDRRDDERRGRDDDA